MSLTANYTAEALDSVNNSTDVNGLLETLTNLVENVTNFLPTLLALGQENNRALKSLCGMLGGEYGNNVCSTGSTVMVPSMLGMGVAMAVVLVMSMVDHFA